MKKYIRIIRQFMKFYGKYEEIDGGLYYKLGNNRYIKISL
jgi:hypothetical protein